jgi:hypothetical protein
VALTPVDTASSATITPTGEAGAPFFVGISAGDTYRAGDVAVDIAREKAYVYQAMSETGGPTLSVVDLRRGQVERLISLGQGASSGAGQLLLAPDGVLAFTTDPERRLLTSVDLRTGAVGQQLHDVEAAALSQDGSRIYAAGAQDVRAYGVGGLDAGAIWSVSLPNVNQVAADAERVAVTLGGTEPRVVLLDARDGARIADASLPDFPRGLASGPDGGWAVRTGLESLLLRYDRSLNKIAQAAVPSGEGLFYDAWQDRYLLSGYQPGSGEPVAWALRGDDLTLEIERPLPAGELFASRGDGRVVAVPRGWGASRLSLLDPVTLAADKAVILGVNLTDMALHEERNTLYLADDQGRVHVIGLNDGKTRAVWDGAAPIALDEANDRLYVNRPHGVVALDSRSGEVEASFPQRGKPAPDPNRDLVYVTERGVTMYDRAGRSLGRLASTFPLEGATYPSPYAVSAQVNPVTGYLAVVMNNGTPGSSNRSYLRFYPPRSDEGGKALLDSVYIQDLIFDPETGVSYVSYGPAMNQEAVYILGGYGEEIGRLAGRTGSLALDRSSDALYAVAADALAQIDDDSLDLRAVYKAPRGGAAKALAAPLTRRLYIMPANGPRLHVVDLAAPEPFDMQPVAVDALPADLDTSALYFGKDEDRIWLYLINTNNEIYRADATGPDGVDILTWERLPVGSLQSLPYLTVLPNGVIYRAGQGNYGSDGVWRSSDSGETWELWAQGLDDLRGSQAVQALGTEVAYFVSRTSGIYAWHPGDPGHWERIVTPESSYDFPGNLHLAPDGTLFLQTYDELKRSADGRTWESLPASGGINAIAGFHPDYATNHTVFAMFCSPEKCAISRSTDEGQSWEPVLSLPSYSAPLQLQTDGERLYLFHSGYPSPGLYRSSDTGLTWQAAELDALTEVTALGVAPDGALWLGERGGVRRVVPETLEWKETEATRSPDAASGTPMPRPAASTPGPCAQPLSSDDSIIASNAPALGCPLAPSRTLPMARQSFDYGQMIWLSDERLILILNQDGTWQDFADEWTEGQPETDPGIVAPAGRLQPIRGFGKVWRERLGGSDAQVGWASEQETAVVGEVQDWQNGRVFRFDREWLVMLDVGRWEALEELR